MPSKKKIQDIRRDYSQNHLDTKSVDVHPVGQFKLWMEDTLKVDFIDPTAMSVSTVSKSGRPSSRIVLLKSYDEQGFVFFTNYDSKKGENISANSKASILFYWDRLERQIRIEGVIEKISDAESEEYFHSRPYKSRIGAWASHQSKELSSRSKLVKGAALLMTKYPLNPPKPNNWGGYRLIPDYFEYWQGRESRLHDRIIYELVDSKWCIKRLYP